MQTQISFHNTTYLQNAELQQAEEKAQTQDQKVLQFFTDHPAKDFTPAEVHNKMLATGAIDYRVPITSIRRAICNLTEAGKLVKTTTKRTGIYGAKNFTWILNINN